MPPKPKPAAPSKKTDQKKKEKVIEVRKIRLSYSKVVSMLLNFVPYCKPLQARYTF